MPSLSAVILRGARAAQPAANSVAEGALYYVTDENVTERSNGSSWETYNDASGAATDHGLLTGLTDDDHPQYLLTTDATSRANFAAKWADLTAGPDSNLVDANVTQEPWEFILPGTGITVTIEGDSGSAARLAVDPSVVVTQDNANWVDLTDGGATTLHSHSGGAYDSTVPTSQSDFVEADDTNEDVTDLIQAGTNITITELGTRGLISIASSGGSSSVWTPYGPSSLITAPPTSSWSWDNQNSATITSTAYSTEQIFQASGTGTGLHIRYRTAPTVPYTITALLHLNAQVAANFIRFGLLFRQSSDGKIAYIGLRTDTGTLASAKYTNSTTFSADYSTAVTARRDFTTIWFQVIDDNTNRKVKFSWDGFNFIQYHSVTRTDFLTADQVGFFLQTEAIADAYLHLVSWVAS